MQDYSLLIHTLMWGKLILFAFFAYFLASTCGTVYCAVVYTPWLWLVAVAPNAIVCSVFIIGFIVYEATIKVVKNALGA